MPAGSCYREGQSVSDEQPGLRMRVAQESRRIASQHQQLGALHTLVAKALEQADAAQAGQCFLRLRDALDAHMSLEDELYFPALHGLRPELEDELTQLARDHQRFRSELQSLTASFDAGELGRSQAGLDRFAGAFAAHELREETLVDPDHRPRKEDAKP